MTHFDDLIVQEMPRPPTQARRLLRDIDLAEDLVHDTVVRALAKRETYAGDGSLQAWLHAILRNAARDAVKREVRTPDLLPIEPGIEPTASPLQEEAVRCADILDEVERLAPGRRDALLVEMNVEGDQSGRAARMGITLATYRTRVHRAREDMRARLGSG